ncbi:MAG TPA: protein translocase subunit SecF [Candidatus Binatia bacterium]|nr:protein translocase subunit SecF [Candidatus Binatia bacterium]
MELIPHDINIDFVGKRRFFVLFSAVVNLASIVLMLTWGFNYGVDFVGGAVVEVRFPQPTTTAAIEQSLGKVGLEDLTMQDLGGDSRTFLLHFKQGGEGMGAVGSTVKSALTASFGDTFETLRVEAVGAKVSGDLRRRGFLSVAFATLFMSIYIGARFEVRFGLGAVIALIHDVLVVTGALVLTQLPFDLSVLAAILTVVGYSVHDTIIVSDRIRENMRKFRRESLAVIMNRSINETLSRTIITSGTAVLVLLALFTFGGYVIRPFAFTLIIGFITGTYSSIYIAAPVVLSFERGPARPRRTGERERSLSEPPVLRAGQRQDETETSSPTTAAQANATVRRHARRSRE